jgi:soluble lytic murein transglycosylase-like protein
MKYLNYILFIIILVAAFYLNVKLNETQEVPVINSTTLIDTTTSIIAKEGKISTDLARKYAEWIFEASVRYTVDPILILSIMSIESRFNYKAVAPGGTIGLMQIAHSYHKEKSTKSALFEPKNNIMVGTRIMSEYYTKSRDHFTMLLRYNASERKEAYATKVINKKLHYEKLIQKELVK